MADNDLEKIKKEELKDLAVLHKLEDSELLQDFLVDFKSDKLLGISDKIDALTEKGECLRELLDIPENVMNLYYSCANDVFDKKKYQEAANSFIFLTMLDPFVYDYWMPLGLSEHMSKNYEKALHAYGLAALIDTENPTPHYFAGRCYNEIKDSENAKHSFELAIENAGDNEEHAPIKMEAEKSIKVLKK